MNRKKKWIALVLAGTMAFGLYGCKGGNDPGENRDRIQGEKTSCLTEGIQAGSSNAKEPDDVFRKAYGQFAAGLFRETYKTGAEFISPYSAYAALAMVLNGADGATLEDMCKTFGLSADELNAYLKVFADRYNNGQSVTVANSVWFNGSFREEVRKEFLQTVAGYYSAEAFSADFSDPKTLGDMNAWVEEKTLGRIKDMLDQLDAGAVMVLFNTLTFDGKWADPFDKEATKEEDFRKAGGQTGRVQMMSGEAEAYFESETYIGFEKNYEDGFYFRAYLPKEGYTAKQLAEALSGDQLANPGTYDGKAYVKMPKITLKSNMMDLIPALTALGMGSAFGGAANFSRITNSGVPILISEVNQKTYLEIDEEGTKAATATEVGLRCYAAAPVPVNHTVVLDSPFIYMICDRTTDIPLFIGIYE
ncbi:MAG: serpin family protein [Lachnospiraceae bacterium]|nr:serpin family protein [Lachnospiraceae bacterium]